MNFLIFFGGLNGSLVGLVVKNDLPAGENAAGRLKVGRVNAADAVDSEPARRGMSVL